MERMAAGPATQHGQSPHEGSDAAEGVTHEAVEKVLAAMRGVRVRDPASRDQDATAWRRGRFAERVRREWNPVPTAAVAATGHADGYDLEALARVIQARVGGGLAPITARLEEFAALEDLGQSAAPDALLRPGSKG